MGDHDTRDYYYDYDNIITDMILLFDQTLGEWREIGNMLEARWGHAASTVNWHDVENYCVD